MSCGSADALPQPGGVSLDDFLDDFQKKFEIGIDIRAMMQYTLSCSI